jgi:hypothetical protein
MKRSKFENQVQQDVNGLAEGGGGGGQKIWRWGREGGRKCVL